MRSTHTFVIFAGDPIPPKCAVIEVHVGELKQLFDAIDPSPFRDRDLDQSRGIHRGLGQGPAPGRIARVGGEPRPRGRSYQTRRLF
jgi:hypothetical protein